MWGAVGLTVGCSFDSSGDSGLPSESVGQTAPSSASMGATDDGSGSTSGAGVSTSMSVSSSDSDPTFPAVTSDAATTDSDSAEVESTTGPGVEPTTGGYGATGPGAALFNEAVVVRYFLDEAPSGSTPMQAVDATDEPFNLPIDYSGMGLAYDQDGSNRGLRWDAVALDAAPRASIGESELAGLNGASQLTYEVVVEIDQVSDQRSRILHIGAGDGHGQLTLTTDQILQLQFAWNDAIERTWPFDALSEGRAVVHVVVETDAPAPADRIRLYVNGAEIVPSSAGEIEQGSTVELSEDAMFVLGNRDMDRSFRGMLYYASVYGVALDGDAIAQNVEALTRDDDR